VSRDDNMVAVYEREADVEARLAMTEVERAQDEPLYDDDVDAYLMRKRRR